MIDRVIWLDKLSIKDVEVVGGKNASLGAMEKYRVSEFLIRVVAWFIVLKAH